MARGERPISSLILAELYESSDRAFLQQILDYNGNLKPVIGIVEKWKKDNRPFARQLKFDFIASQRVKASHRVIFKRLFKQAWADRDHELMAAFLARLDTMLRRKRRMRYRFSSGLIEQIETLRLAQSRNAIFSTPTAHYLRRRAWRYFRRLGFGDPAVYLSSIVRALVRYTDDDVRSGENLLDNWGLMHACFGKSPVIEFNARHTNLKIDSSLASLEPAPMFEKHWSADAASDTLLDLLIAAQCRPVRVWSIALLKRHHAKKLTAITPERLFKLIDHTDTDVAAFGAEILNDANIAPSLPMATWLALLKTRNPTVVASIAQAFSKFVNSDRVTTPQAVEIATQAAVPVARIGLAILQQRTIAKSDRASLAGLAAARSSAVAGEIAVFALKLLNTAGEYQVEQVGGFFDSRLRPMRDSAFGALDDQSPAGTDPAFWARLLESPYDDVRANLVDRLRKRQSLPGASAESLAWLWQSVLLNIHRGGRAKLTALNQMSRRIMQEPQTASVLLPIMAVALRSVRAPEARHGLAAVVTAVERIPQLAADVSKYLPELQLDALAMSGAIGGAS